MNTLLCIGCDRYDALRPLRGAEKDAQAVLELLKGQDGVYDPRWSRLLLSPGVQQIKDALDGAFPMGEEVDLFTFFFAGHACVKTASFYLCAQDSNPDRLSTTAFPISLLFTAVNEFRPREVNLVIDACQAGGSSFDLSQLAKPEIIGCSQSSSISFLGACSADQFAGESDEGGFLTRELIRCLTGEQEVQAKLPFLDLMEVGAVVCRALGASHPDQKPIRWGLSLFGTGHFARNPHFDAGGADRAFPVANVSPRSNVGRSVRSHSAALWDEYRATRTDPNPRRLLDLLHDVLEGAGNDVGEMIAFLQGLSPTLMLSAQSSSDSFAPSQCLATCAASLLPWIHMDNARRYTRDALRHLMTLNESRWKELLALVKTRRHALLNSREIVADIYYLPMRIAKTLGWIGLSTALARLLPELDDRSDSERFDLVSRIVEEYAAAIVSVSEEQAPHLYVFVKACLLSGRRDLAERVTNSYFGSLVERKGNITRPGTDGVGALRYMLSLGHEQFRPPEWRPANPSQLLAILLLLGSTLGLGRAWDLRALDRKVLGVFLPADYRDFTQSVIEKGVNHTQQVGFGVWSLKGFREQFDRAFKESLSSRTSAFLPEEAALCTISALLFPDRVPLLLEAALPQTPA